MAEFILKESQVKLIKGELTKENNLKIDEEKTTTTNDSTSDVQMDPLAKFLSGLFTGQSIENN